MTGNMLHLCVERLHYLYDVKKP